MQSLLDFKSVARVGGLRSVLGTVGERGIGGNVWLVGWSVAGSGEAYLLGYNCEDEEELQAAQR